jgi:GNAT superfamily N-acetyltransferase
MLKGIGGGMKIYQFEKTANLELLRALMREYLMWVRDNLQSEFGINYSDEIIDSVIDNDLANLEEFLPPMGCLFLAEVDNELAGMVCLKDISEGVAEVKRMYVRPQFRRFGLGRILINSLLDEAKAMNYSIIRLESSHFMKNAHQLYRSLGFKEIERYEGGEAPDELVAHTFFMELSLSTND